MNDIEKTKGWLSVAMIVWPILRLVFKGFGVDLPDLGFPTDYLAHSSQVVGTYLLARTDTMKTKPRSLPPEQV